MFTALRNLRAIGIVALGTYVTWPQEHLDCLGLMGYIGKSPKAAEIIIEGLESIQNNDYDSAGLATIHGKEVRLSKYLNSSESKALPKLRAESLVTHSSSCIGIGHTHISRRGMISELKTHPQSDHKNRIFVAHNGSITNSNELLQFVESRGINPTTDSNTELLAILIGIFIDDGHPLKVATRLALEKTAGSWAIIVMDKENPDQLVVSQKGSQLFLSMENQEIVISSDEKVLKGKVLKVEDSYVYSLNPNMKKIESIRVKDLNSLLSLGDYPHWTIKEIEEQPQSVARAINYGARLTNDSAKLKGLEEIKEQFLSVKNLMLIGCGSSFHACQFGSHIMKHLQLMDTVITIDPSSNFNLIPSISPGAIFISQSGETQEILNASEKLLSLSIPCISIVNEVSSSLAKRVGHGVYMNAGKEVAEAATKSFLSSCVVLIEIALWLSKFEYPEKSEYRQKIVNSLLALPMMTGSVIARNKEPVKDLANYLKKEEHIFVLGRGMGESIAYEGAELLKQLPMIHAEGYAGGALKHGPFALIGDGTPIILIILDDEHKDMMNLALAEVQARNAKTIVITPNKSLITSKEPPNRVLLIEENGPLTGLLAVIPLQLLAYYLSIQRELDPDFPWTSEAFIPVV